MRRSCAFLGISAFLAELTITLCFGAPLRHIVIDAPLLGLLWQMVFLAGLYALAGAAGGVLIFLLLQRIFPKRRDAASLLSVRALAGLILFQYAFWAWRREILPKQLPVLLFIVLGSGGLPFLLRAEFLRRASHGKRLWILFLPMLVAVLFFRIGGLRTLHPAPNATAPPNLLILSVDTLRPDHLSCYGYQNMTTPVIDRLAAEGILFEQAVTPVPLTGPSFASILTGTYPQTHGSRQNLHPLRPEALTLAEHLRSQGYRTAAFVSGYPLRRSFSGLDQGFDLYQDRFSFFDGFKLLRPFERLGWITLQLERKAEAVDPLVRGWLTRHSSQPFFIWVHYFDPHMPYTPPCAGESGVPRSRQRLMHGISKEAIDPETFERMLNLYDGEIASADRSIGRIVSFLKEAGLLDRTLIVFVSDHGESFGHDYLFDHANRLYDDTVRIALILRPPALLPKGVRFRPQVQSIDLFPTILSLLKIEGPAAEGQAIALSQNHPFSPFAYLETEGHPSFPVERPLKGIRTERWKYIASAIDRQEALYDLSVDPGETINVAATHPEETVEFRVLLAEWMSKGHPSPPPPLSEEQIRHLKSLGYLQ